MAQPKLTTSPDAGRPAQPSAQPTLFLFSPCCETAEHSLRGSYYDSASLGVSRCGGDWIPTAAARRPCGYCSAAVVVAAADRGLGSTANSVVRESLGRRAAASLDRDLLPEGRALTAAHSHWGATLYPKILPPTAFRFCLSATLYPRISPTFSKIQRPACEAVPCPGP